MSAANASAPSPSLQEETRAHEPSMEEILASIRRIIADDDSFPAARREREDRFRRQPEPQPAPEPAPPAVIHAAAPEPTPPADAAPRTESAKQWLPHPAPLAEIRQLRLNRAEPAPEIERQPESGPEPRLEPVVAVESEVEVEEEAFDAEAFDEEADFPVALVAELDEQQAYAGETGSPLVSADTATSVATHFQALAASMIINDSGMLQKYAQDMMRPMLKEWLDDNLPIIVERLVRAEIERVARGGRR